MMSAHSTLRRSATFGARSPEGEAIGDDGDAPKRALSLPTHCQEAPKALAKAVLLPPATFSRRDLRNILSLDNAGDNEVGSGICLMIKQLRLLVRTPGPHVEEYARLLPAVERMRTMTRLPDAIDSVTHGADMLGVGACVGCCMPLPMIGALALRYIVNPMAAWAEAAVMAPRIFRALERDGFVLVPWYVPRHVMSLQLTREAVAEGDPPRCTLRIFNAGYGVHLHAQYDARKYQVAYEVQHVLLGPGGLNARSLLPHLARSLSITRVNLDARWRPDEELENLYGWAESLGEPKPLDACEGRAGQKVGNCIFKNSAAAIYGSLSQAARLELRSTLVASALKAEAFNRLTVTQQAAAQAKQRRVLHSVARMREVERARSRVGDITWYWPHAPDVAMSGLLASSHDLFCMTYYAPRRELLLVRRCPGDVSLRLHRLEYVPAERRYVLWEAGYNLRSAYDARERVARFECVEEAAEAFTREGSQPLMRPGEARAAHALRELHQSREAFVAQVRQEADPAWFSPHTSAMPMRVAFERVYAPGGKPGRTMPKLEAKLLHYNRWDQRFYAYALSPTGKPEKRPIFVELVGPSQWGLRPSWCAKAYDTLAPIAAILESTQLTHRYDV